MDKNEFKERWLPHADDFYLAAFRIYRFPAGFVFLHGLVFLRQMHVVVGAKIGIDVQGVDDVARHTG